MGIYIKIFFTALIVCFILAIVLSITKSWLWIFYWPASWVLLALGACVDLSVGNVNDEQSEEE